MPTSVRAVWRLVVSAVMALGAACSSNSVNLVPDSHSGGAQNGGGGKAGSEEGGAAGEGEPGGAGSYECSTDRDARCSVDGILEVCKSGSWVREQACGPGLCSVSRRSCLSCAPGSFNCEKGSPILKQCNLDGTAWDVVRTCDSSDACVAVGDVGYCKLCKPDDATCDAARREYPTAVAASGDHSRPSTSLRACNEQGSGTVPLQACGMKEPVCDGAAKTCRVCSPGLKSCIGSELYSCKAEGKSLELIEDCGHPALCNTAAAACLRGGCQKTPKTRAEVGSVICEKSALSICRASGKWEVLDICEGDAACSAGVDARLCLSSADHCLPGTTSCAEDQVTLQYCAGFTDAARSALTLGQSYAYAHCAAGCSVDADGNAACEPVASNQTAFSDELVCVPGSDSYLSCDVDGCVEAQCSTGLVCADARLGCRSCVPGATRCDGNRLLRCDAQGGAEKLVEDCGEGVCDKIRERCLPAMVGDRYCEAGVLRSVGVDGSLQTIENCGAPELCDANAGCKPAYCLPGSISCQASAVLTCEDGTELTPTGESCESDERCEEGLGCAVAARVAAGDAHTCALIVAKGAEPAATGYVKCWGANESGQLGNGASLLGDEPQARPVVSRLAGDLLQASANFRSSGLCAGKNFSCADITLASGEPGVACWGANDHGQLGIGGKASTASMAALNSNRIELPVSRVADSAGNAVPETAFVGLHAVTCGADFACALDAGERAHCWGSNEVGQLGTGQASLTSSPLALPVSSLGPLKRLSAGGRHVCSIDDKNQVSCWGDNSKAQLGLGNTNVPDSFSPLQVEGLAASDLALGRDFTLALRATDLVGWGQNTFGQLANGGSSVLKSPSPTTGIDVARTSLIASGSSAAHACALVNGWLWCWGANSLAQLGDGSRLDRVKPVAAIASDANHLPGGAGSVALGKAHTCAIDGEGSIWCWGANQRRQLGRASVAATATMPLRVY
jgi:alpha-tubulin suppressor-like RCC1 family protein